VARLREEDVARTPVRSGAVARVPAPDAFALPRALGNQAFATLARRDKDQDFKDAGSGHSVRRIQVNGVKGGFTDMAMVILPDVLPQDGGAVEILLFMHGHHVRGAHGYEQEGAAQGDDLAFHKIPQQLAAAGRSMVAILPQGGHHSEFGPNAAKGVKGFNADAYIASVFDNVTAMKAWGTTKPPTPGGVVLSGHSGADVGIGQMLDKDLGPKQLEGLLLFDTMWPNAGHQEKIWTAVERRLNGDLTGLAEIANRVADEGQMRKAQVDWVVAKGFRLFDMFNPQGTYAGESNDLKKEVEGWLRRGYVKDVIGDETSPVYQAIARNLVVEASATHHDYMLSKDDHLKKAVGMLPPQPPPKAGGTP
jgi:hypothetical protein